LVGEDGSTHHGQFDIALLNSIPNLAIISPMDEWELRNAMYFAKDYTGGPVVIRYPKGRGSQINYKNSIAYLPLGKARVVTEGDEVAVLSIGTIGVEVQKALEHPSLLKSVQHVDLRFVKPLDNEMVQGVLSGFDKILTVDEASVKGGLADILKSMAQDLQYTGLIRSIGIADEFIEHGTIAELRKKCGIDAESIREIISNL
jgi:1-deoxy-D-xylulose-5-phosphate synthase